MGTDPQAQLCSSTQQSINLTPAHLFFWDPSVEIFCSKNSIYKICSIQEQKPTPFEAWKQSSTYSESTCLFLSWIKNYLEVSNQPWNQHVKWHSSRHDQSLIISRQWPTSDSIKQTDPFTQKTESGWGSVWYEHTVPANIGVLVFRVSQKICKAPQIAISVCDITPWNESSLKYPL